MELFFKNVIKGTEILRLMKLFIEFKILHREVDFNFFNSENFEANLNF